MIKLLVNYRNSILFSLFICFVLFLPGNRLPKHNILHFDHFDKMVHAVLFLSLEWFLLKDSLILKLAGNFQKVFYKTMLVIVFAVFTEIVQHLLITEREGNIFDFFADLIGVIAGIALYRYFLWLINRFFLPRI